MPFRNYKKTESKPPNVISNADSDPEEEEEDETILPTDEEEEVVECHGIWDFILHNSDIENEQEAFPVTTRSKSTSEPPQDSKKRSAGATNTKEKTPTRKLVATTPQNQPSSSTIPSTSKTLAISDSMDYNIVDDMKKTKENITIFELRKLKH